NVNRERIYVQQPPISAPGFSSQAFAPHFPHTVRTTETKTCSDCHVSAANDNNAIMSQLLLLGTNYVNFIGLNAWVGQEQGIEAVRVSEWSEPQAVFGSYLHKYAYPDFYKLHVEKNGRELRTWRRGPAFAKGLKGGEAEAAEDIANVVQKTGGAARCLQLRGEYMYVAEGRGGFRAYDVASIANKGVSEKILTAPFSPLGDDTHVASKNATCMALPTNQSIAPGRNTPEMRAANQEQAFHPIYSYAFITDAEEGLIAVNINTLTDGDPRNNSLQRAMTWNPGGLLKGARHITLGGHYAYIAADAGLVVVDLDDPLKPKVAATLALPDVRASALQFRYLFVTTARGLEVVDVTRLNAPRIVPGALIPLADARRVYVARTYAYVAAKTDGLVIVDVKYPEQPRVYQKADFGGRLNDAEDVVVGSTNASLFAYVADGRNGMKVVQLTSPSSQPNFYGFSPPPKPELIAWAKTPSPALAMSKGLDRDRAVDETGHQIAVFGRLGSRPFNRPEMERFFLDAFDRPYSVTDDADMAAWVAANR
ncbi:MAG: repeat protein precursor, partial [Phenylobacterium sp.]|nr:repeat protein precursor [Phenylobacterium sp.]